MAGRRAIGILGGTFDPIHLGHLSLAREARRALDLERVLMVPNAIPPHKGSGVSTPEHRAAMVYLAIADDPALELSRLELDRPGPSYAVDTVAAVAERSRAEGRPEPWFILSDEALAELPTWREPERILDLARIAAAHRPGWPRLQPDWLEEHFPGSSSRVTFLDGPDLDIAASDVRVRVARGEDISGLVPQPVAAYIARHGLYGAAWRTTPTAGMP
jgi:nicotinate-nucleotide adenylyltransferase